MVEQYFEINNLSINPSKTHYILFETRQCSQENNLKILVKNREISNVKSTDFLGVVIDSVGGGIDVRYPSHINNSSHVVLVHHFINATSITLILTYK
jgi:hypothetical protein